MRARLQTCLEEKASLLERAENLEQERSRLEEQASIAHLEQSHVRQEQGAEKELRSLLDQVVLGILQSVSSTTEYLAYQGKRLCAGNASRQGDIQSAHFRN